MTMRVIDTETTGVDPTVDKIVEVASVDLTRNGGIANAMARRVHPGVPIPPVASAVHHIIDADIANCDVIELAIEPFRGATVYIAHNAKFDQGFLAPHLGSVPWICTYKTALRVWPDAPGHSNQVLRYWRGHVTPFGRARSDIAPHEALSDVIVTAALAHELLKAAPYADLLKWSAEPALMTKIGFGKHFGKRFDEAPVDYLQWILKTDFDEDVKFSARYWLDKR